MRRTVAPIPVTVLRVASYLGKSNSSVDKYFGGQIDEAGIWNRALSSSEVSQLYNSGIGLQYPFNTPTH